MSMIAEVRRVPAEELAELIRDPSEIFWFVHGTEPYQTPPGLLARMFRRDPPPIERPPWQPPPEGCRVDLGKAWHCLHYLLTGEPWGGELPAAYLLSGGTQLGEIDVGYGPARALSPDQVVEFHQHLRTLSEADLSERFDPAEMERAEIYGAARSKEELPHLWAHLEALRDLLGDAASAGDGAIIYLY